MKSYAMRVSYALFFTLLTSSILAGCSAGGDGTSAFPPQSQNPPLPQSLMTQATAGNVTFAIGITPGKATAGFRTPQYVSPSTESMRILTDDGNAVVVDLSPSSPKCSPNPKVPGSYICTASLTVPAGNHVFTVTAYDLPGGKGNVLSTNSTGTVYVKPTGKTTVSIVLLGVVKYVTLTLSTSDPPVGKAATIVLTAVPEDADHNVIVGPGTFEHPLTLTTTDPVNGPLSKTTLNSPADESGITVKYSGASVASIIYSATAIGLPAANVTDAVLMPTTGTPCPSSAAGTGVLYDGDFAQTIYPGVGFVTDATGATFAPDWSATGTSIDFVGMYFSAPKGLCSVDLDGTPGPGGIAHTPFTTIIGATYTVSFLFSGNGACGASVKDMKVTAAGQSDTFTWNTAGGNDAQHGVFNTKAWSFTADSTQTELRFMSEDPPGLCGPVVAAVSVTKN